MDEAVPSLTLQAIGLSAVFVTCFRRGMRDFRTTMHYHLPVRTSDSSFSWHHVGLWVEQEERVAEKRIHLHKGDLPAGLAFPQGVAVDSETLGLKVHRDRLCLVQLSAGDGEAHLVQMDRAIEPVRLKSLLSDSNTLKIFHFARFDVAALRAHLGVDTRPLYCTKIASRLVRTYTDRHGLKDLCAELLGVELSKQQQSSDWGAAELSEAQLAYAAADVLYLHRIKDRLDAMLTREGRTDLAAACFSFLPVRARLDLAGFEDMDIFEH